MSSSPQHRQHYRPAADFNQRVVPVTRQPQRNWFRVHWSGTSPVQFGVGTYHRFSHPAAPFPMLYLGASLSVCLWEYFGDDVFCGRHVISATKWNGCSISQIGVPQLKKICAVGLEPTRNAMGVDKASLMAADLQIPQQWGLAVQQHPAAFEGIKYSSRFMDQACLALFERGGMAAKLHTTLLGKLQDLDGAVNWLDEHHIALV